jgi:hypothetical protein
VEPGKANRPRAAVRMFPAFPALLGCAMACLTGCFTEVGNPGKTQVSATFSIDYANDPPVLPKRAQGSAGAPDSIHILYFRFNVVEVNYVTAAGEDGRIWKVPDSLGQNIDFTGQDTAAALPPVQVPPGEWTIMKLESRIPAHQALLPDSLDFAGFRNPGYIKGSMLTAGREIRFVCQFPNDYKINLVYEQATLEKWKHGDAYDLEFIFFAKKWLSVIPLAEAPALPDRSGLPVVIIDQEHNPDLYRILWDSFFKSFNSDKVWKENPVGWPAQAGLGQAPLSNR